MQISQWAKKIIVSSLSPFAITSLSFAAWFAPFYEFATLYVAGNATSMNTGSWFMPKVNNLVNRIYLIVQFVFPPTGTVVASFRQLRSTRWLLPVTTARTKRWWLTLKTLPTPFIRIRLWPLDRQECCATLSMLIHVVSTHEGGAIRRFRVYWIICCGPGYNTHFAVLIWYSSFFSVWKDWHFKERFW